MPLYEYQCQQCKVVSEKIQKFSEPPLTRCEKCGGKLERLLSSPAIQFKGGGWYITDYARKAESKPPAEGGKPASEAAKTPDAKATSGGSESTKSKPAETPSVKK